MNVIIFHSLLLIKPDSVKFRIDDINQYTGIYYQNDWELPEIIQIVVIVVQIITTAFIYKSLKAQNRAIQTQDEALKTQNLALKEQINYIAHEIYIESVKPISDEDLILFRESHEDFIDTETYNRIYLNDGLKFKRLIKCSRLYEYIGFLFDRKKFLDNNELIKTWLLYLNKAYPEEFNHVNEYLQEYFPQFYLYINTIIKSNKAQG